MVDEILANSSLDRIDRIERLESVLAAATHHTLIQVLIIMTAIMIHKVILMKMITGSDHHAIMIMIHKIIPMTMITVSSSADLRPVPRPPANHGRCRNTGGTTNFFLKYDNYHHYYQI